VPGTNHGRSAKRIASCPAKGVPVHDAEPQMVFHRETFNDLLLVVPFVGKRILALRTFVSNLADFRKCRHRTPPPRRCHDSVWVRNATWWHNNRIDASLTCRMND